MPTSPARNARTWRQVSRHVALVCTLTLLSYTGTRGAIAAQSWGIDEAHTSIGFKIDAVGFPTTLGHFSHYSGRILIDLEHPLKSFTTFTVDSASVDLGSKSFNHFVKSSFSSMPRNFRQSALHPRRWRSSIPAPHASQAISRCSA